MRDNDSTYQGWTNYPTWAVHLWLSNDEGLYDDARRIVNAEWSDYDAGIALKEYIEELSEVIAPNIFGASFVADIYGWALALVDWHEIAEAFRDEEDDEDTEEDEDA